MTYSGESGRKASAQAIIERINQEREKLGICSLEGDRSRSLSWDNRSDRELVRSKFDDVSGEAILPGFGPEGLGGNAREDCGNPHPFVCDSCGNAVDFGRTCGQSVCTRCGVAWVRDLAIRKSAKVRRIRREKHKSTSDAEHQKEHHQVISVPLAWYYDLANAGFSLKEAQEKTKPIVKDILDEMRAQGVLIRHSFRGARDDGSLKTEEDDRGAWKERLNSDREWHGDVRDQLAWMPHYHCIVVSDFLKGAEFTDQIEEKTGWVIHRIANEDTGVSLQDDGAMARALTYSLSHADVDVRDGPNRSAVWEVGTFEGDIIKSNSRFSARPSDLEWADNVVRRLAQRTLGLKSGTTDCGASLPGVDDPDELARRILEELYPQDEAKRSRVDTDAVLHHVSEGNISVSVSSTSGGGGNVTVRDAWGQPVGANGFGGSVPDVRGSRTYSGGDLPAVRELDEDAGDGDDCGCGEDHDRDDDAGDDDSECEGKLIPLEEARQRGLLEDDEWLRKAPFADEARAVDLEHPDDLEAWEAEPVRKTIGGVG